MVHAAAKGVKTGQVRVRLVFDVEDVSEFCQKSACDGLVFGVSLLLMGFQKKGLLASCESVSSTVGMNVSFGPD